MSEITLVTAFFNIGRENFKAIPRTDITYLNNFKFWARMHNKLIVYTDEQTGKYVEEIRAAFGLKDETTIITLADIYSIEPEILKKMREISANPWFRDFRYLPNATSNIADYSYLMLLKTWFLKDAVERGLAKGTISWIDFGFNHGGELYTIPEEFDFEWRYDFSDKIHLFYYQKYDEKPIFEIVRRLCDCFMGCLMIIPDHYCNDLWELNRSAMIALNTADLIDDDQLLLLMSYRAKPEIFEITQSEWFLPLKEYGAPHLSTRIKKDNAGLKYTIKKIKYNLEKGKKVKAYCRITRENMLKKE